ncbi:uncharacterized protein LOC132750460 [Ruditapes philippinarum]|uniref:uncharacterized protein LOC132750460 n=1 Tax=Ruditapes philippinarum TaxID=129788 RepID=UPI00295AB94F|nr:uncharacterized protein LOC132750460 [Ruditapes philippinarum]
MAHEFQKLRVNASMLPSFQGKEVAVLGMAKDVDSNGTSFTLTTCDGSDIRILMQEPLSEYVSGLTEVQGQVDGRNNIQCSKYITFPDEVSDKFNMENYNAAVELMARCPQFYEQGIQPQQS